MSVTTVKERPILFSAAMVRAIRDGSPPKTQTRRVVKPQPSDDPSSVRPFVDDGPTPSGAGRCGHTLRLDECPYGVPGDRLWVREAAYIAPPDFADPDPSDIIDDRGRRRTVGYAASMDWDSVRCATEYGVKKTPSIHMPRWASRITLEVVRVRVERLQDITFEDCLAEGIEQASSVPYGCYQRDTIEKYRELWDSINAKRGGGGFAWALNPWVWVVEFRVVAAGALATPSVTAPPGPVTPPPPASGEGASCSQGGTGGNA